LIVTHQTRKIPSMLTNRACLFNSVYDLCLFVWPSRDEQQKS